MRAFASVPPTVWQTDIKKLRGDADAIAVFFHLLTSPHSNMIGIYPLNIGYLALDLGTPFEGASEGLRRVCEAGLASYDVALEIVWVHEMSVNQVAPRLAAKDNRVSAVAKQLQMLPICPITLAFYERFRSLYHLKDQTILDEFEKGLGRGLEGASEALRSKDKDKDQDKDQEKDQKQDQDQETGKGIIGSGDERLMYPREDDQPEEPYPKPQSISAGRQLLIKLKVPTSRLEDALTRLMNGCLFPCDIEEFQSQERVRA